MHTHGYNFMKHISEFCGYRQLPTSPAADLMKLSHIVASVVMLGQAAASNVSTTSDLNGWYPCSGKTFSDDGSSMYDAECAVYSAPLCYPGICETPSSVDPRVDIFFKRFPATTGDPNTAPNVWMIQGGPGYSSSSMEIYMEALKSQTEGAVNIYTMDHRGTGRSTMLDCVAAQVTTTGSPWGSDIKPSEVGACAEDLHKKYGNLASFSVTSAATDLATFISTYTNGAHTIVYGVSYGTILVERLMHLAPPEVTGYVLDGVATSSGASADEFLYLTKRNTDFNEVGNYFMALCDKNSQCNSYFEPKSLNTTLENVIQQFDNNPNSTCAERMGNLTMGEPAIPPSSALRIALGAMVQDWELGPLIPSVVLQLDRCLPEDLESLDWIIASVNSRMSGTVQDEAYHSNLLYYLIVFSEMWESPSPFTSELKERFLHTGMVDRDISLVNSLYCAFSKDKSPACKEFDFGTYDADGLVYKRDQYWNKAATIPSQSSVLILSGKLDPVTPHKYAESLLKVLNGDKKELIAFDYSFHGTVMSTQLIADDYSTYTCGMIVLASYVRSDGDLKLLDKSCVGEVPAFNLTVSINNSTTANNSTDDGYDSGVGSSLRH